MTSLRAGKGNAGQFLFGEIRPVPSAQELREALRHGFTRAVVPKANVPKKGVDGLDIVAVERLSEALDAV